MIRERDVVTVLIDHREGQRALRPFFCCKCGKCVCEVFGDAYIIAPGMPDGLETGSLGVNTAVNCPGFQKTREGANIKCNAKYIF